MVVGEAGAGELTRVGLSEGGRLSAVGVGDTDADARGDAQRVSSTRSGGTRLEPSTRARGGRAGMRMVPGDGRGAGAGEVLFLLGVRGDARVPFFNRDVRCVLFLFLHVLAPPAAGTGVETGAGTEGSAAALSTAPWVAQVSGTSSFSMIIPMVGSFLEEIEEPPAA